MISGVLGMLGTYKNEMMKREKPMRLFLIFFGPSPRVRMRGEDEEATASLAACQVGDSGAELASIPFQSIFGIFADVSRALKGGFSLREKPLECLLSVNVNSENAVRVRKTVERWTGNGGQMAEETGTKQEVTEGKRKRTVGKKERCSESKTGCSDCVVGGETRLRRAACDMVREKSTEIAEAMVKKAIEGESNSAKLLLALMNPKGRVGVEKKKRQGRSTARMLAAEPEWQGPMDGLLEEMDDEGLWADEPIVARW